MAAHVPVAAAVAVGLGAVVTGGAYYAYRNIDKLKELLGLNPHKMGVMLPPKVETPPNTPKVVVPPPPAPPPAPPPVPVPPAPDDSSIASNVIALSDVNTRSTPSTSGALVAKNDLRKGCIAKVLNWNAGSANGYDWAKIITPGGSTGYAAKQFLQPTDKVGQTADSMYVPSFQDRKEIKKEEGYRPYLQVATMTGEFGAESAEGCRSALARAKDLYRHFVSHGHRGESALVKRFQLAHNACRAKSGLPIELVANGVFDPATSAALTQYTNAPIPANPRNRVRGASLGESLTARNLSNRTNAGAARLSRFNLETYIKNWGVKNDDPNFVLLVRQFQHDVNTDPLYPGPAYKLSPRPKSLHLGCTETGSFDDCTRDAYNRAA